MRIDDIPQQLNRAWRLALGYVHISEAFEIYTEILKIDPNNLEALTLSNFLAGDSPENLNLEDRKYFLLKALEFFPKDQLNIRGTERNDIYRMIFFRYNIRGNREALEICNQGINKYLVKVLHCPILPYWVLN